jgi:hypothetical protein
LEILFKTSNQKCSLTAAFLMENKMNKTNMYDVYQFFFHIGRYGEHKRVATFNNEADAKKRVDEIWSRGLTGSYKTREVIK